MGILRELLSDARKLISNMDSEWRMMADMANRRINNVADACAWLAIDIDGGRKSWSAPWAAARRSTPEWNQAE